MQNFALNSQSLLICESKKLPLIIGVNSTIFGVSEIIKSKFLIFAFVLELIISVSGGRVVIAFSWFFYLFIILSKLGIKATPLSEWETSSNIILLLLISLSFDY